MQVNLLNIQPLQNALSGARICYNSDHLSDSTPEMVGPKDMRLLVNCVKAGHESVIEHVNATYMIQGVSRALTHQLVRHRLVSFSQASQRYINQDHFEFVLPKSIENSLGEEYFSCRMELIQQWYTEMVEAGVPKEDARFVLPNAATTKIQMTCNLRELLHIFRLRLPANAQWEIRQLAKSILDSLPEQHYELLYKAVLKGMGVK